MASPGHVCLATMLDVARLSSLLRLRTAWYGELSAAVLGRRSERLAATRAFISSATELEQSMAIGLFGSHESRGETRISLLENVGYDCPRRFPYNQLRNLAYRACSSEFVLSLDVDLIPMPSGPAAYAELRSLVNLGTLSARRRRAWILPAFEVSPIGLSSLGKDGISELATRPVGKEELKDLASRRLVAPFYSGSWRSHDPSANLSFSNACARDSLP